MKILIDSGNGKNIGDNAIIANVIDYLYQNTDANLYVMDKGKISAAGHDNKRIIIVKNAKDLVRMPYWRFSNYTTQPWLLNYIYGFIFWTVLIFRGARLMIDARFCIKYKKHIDYSPNIRYWSELLSKMDAYWVVGGGNINDIWGDHTFCKMLFSRIFKLLGKPVIFSGQGIGPLDRISTRLVLRYGAKNITLASVRDKESLHNLEKAGMHVNKALLVTDDALTISSGRDPKLQLPKKFIALNLRLGGYSFSGEKLIDKYIRLVELFAEAYPDCDFVFVPVSYSAETSDAISAEKVISKINIPRRRLHIIYDGLSPYTIKSVLEKALLSIGVSYHFCLFSLSVGTPTFCIYANPFYEQKLMGLAQMFNVNVKDVVFNLHNYTAKKLYDSIDKSFKMFSKSEVLNAGKDMGQKWYTFMKSATNVLFHPDFVHDAERSAAKISVIVPTYNCGKYLPEAVDSVLGQTYQDFEIIIIDDGSTDNTKNIIQKYTKNYPDKIKYFYQENKGLAVARNAGIKQAEGEYIALLDSDDKWCPDRLEGGVRAMESNPKTGLVHARTIRISEEGHELAPIKRDKRFLSGSIFEHIFLRKANISCPTVLIRKACLDKVGLFDENLARLGCEDRELWLRISKEYRCEFIDNVLAYYRMRHSSMSKDINKMMEARYYVVNKYCSNAGNQRRLRSKALANIHNELGDELFGQSKYKDAKAEYLKALSFWPVMIRPLINITKISLGSKVKNA